MSASPLRRYEVTIEGRRFIIEGPVDPDCLVKAAVERGETEPQHWAHLWPSARVLAGHLLESSIVAPGVKVLEIGCGLGLAGIAAAHRGADVVVSDLSTAALAQASRNAELNGVTLHTLWLDWNNISEVLASLGDWTPELIIGADVLYHPGAPEAVGGLIRALACPAVLADPMRAHAADVEQRLREAGLAVWSSPAASGRIMLAQAL